MQGKYDKRKSQDDIRPEDVGADYLDRIVKHAAEFYRPYSKLFAVVGQGNHETAILNNTGTDLTNSFVHRLNADYGGACYRGYYGGWVRFMFSVSTKRESMRLKYFHGGGSGAGVSDINSQAGFLANADFVVNGHTHDQNYHAKAREILNESGIVERRLMHFVRTGTYKDEYADGRGGWAVEKKHAPKPLGCAWIHFWVESSGGRQHIESEVTFSNA